MRPTLVTDCVLDIVNGRNPILEPCVTTFIANDTSMNALNKVHVITGPNNSGKSVYMRQVAYLVFMCQIGCFVPADSAKMGIVDRILTRMQSQDSVSVGHSTFATDVIQMRTMFECATSKSLLLIDEFGKGTLQKVYF